MKKKQKKVVEVLGDSGTCVYKRGTRKNNRSLKDRVYGKRTGTVRL